MFMNNSMAVAELHCDYIKTDLDVRISYKYCICELNRPDVVVLYNVLWLELD